MALSTERHQSRTRKRISLVERTMLLSNKHMSFDMPITTITREEGTIESDGKNRERKVSYSVQSNSYTSQKVGSTGRKMSIIKSSDKTNERKNAKLSLQYPLYKRHNSKDFQKDEFLQPAHVDYDRIGLTLRRKTYFGKRLSLPYLPDRRLPSHILMSIPTKRTSKELRTLLIRVFRLVRTLIRVCLAIRRYVVNKTDSSAEMDIQKYLPARESEVVDLQIKKEIQPFSFNKHLYSVASNHAFPLWARKLCLTPSLIRPMEELLRLQKYLRGIPVFSQFDDRAQIEICRNVIYNRYDRMRVILKQGDNAEYFYIVLAGTVCVNISTKDMNTGVEVTGTYDLIGKHQAFGGNALIHGTKRTATLISHTFVEVLLIDQEIFTDYCCDTILASIQREKTFLKSHQVFNTWSTRSMKLLLYDVKTKFYRPGKVIDSDLVNSKYLFFIMEGVVEIMYSGGNNKKRWLYSPLLGRTIGALGGNRIYAPNPCNLSCIADTDNDKAPKVKCFMISNGATVLYLSKYRFKELAPKDFLCSANIESAFHPLTDSDYKVESKKAITWIEYRAMSAKEMSRFPKHFCSKN